VPRFTTKNFVSRPSKRPPTVRGTFDPPLKVIPEKLSMSSDVSGTPWFQLFGGPWWNSVSCVETVRADFNRLRGGQKLKNSRFLGGTLGLWAVREGFFVVFYRPLCPESNGTDSEVIRLLVVELWFLVYFLYLENEVGAWIFVFFFPIDRYRTLESDYLTYGKSKRLYGSSTYDLYFVRNQRNKKLKNNLRDYSYNQSFA